MDKKNNETYPKISVVTISYNQGLFIEETIKSIIAQNYPNLEYIIIDGGSSDNSTDIIKKYETHISYWVSEKDLGPANALNKGFAKASGDVYYFINSDDILLPNSFNKIINTIKNTPNYDVYYGHGYIIDEKSNIIKKSFSDRWNLLFYANLEVAIFQPSTFIRKDKFISVGGFNENNRTCWDGELLVDLDLIGAKFYRLSNFNLLSCFRLYDTSISGNIQSGNNSYSQRFLNDHDKINEKISNKIYFFKINRYVIKIFKAFRTPYTMLYRIFSHISFRS